MGRKGRQISSNNFPFTSGGISELSKSDLSYIHNSISRIDLYLMYLSPGTLTFFITEIARNDLEDNYIGHIMSHGFYTNGNL